VAIDGKLVGATGASKAVEAKVSPGARRVEVTKDGFAPAVKTVVVDPGGRTVLPVTLEPGP
jgi:hypothetical protein